MLDPGVIAVVLDRTVNLGMACLDNTPSGAPSVSGVYHTAPPAKCCDSLSVWLERIVPGGGDPPQQATFPNEYVGAAHCNLFPIAHIAMRLWRPCWPSLVDNPFNPYPPVETTDTAGLNLAIDAMALWCCISSDLLIDDGTSIIKGGADILAGMGRIEPLPPKGGCAGWDIRFRLELDPCCIGPEVIPTPSRFRLVTGDGDPLVTGDGNQLVTGQEV